MSVNWDKIGTVGEVIFLGKNDKNTSQISTTNVGEGARCPDCNFDNKPDSKFCEMCGTQI